MIRAAVRKCVFPLVTALGLLAAASCSSPETVEQFVPVSEADPAGRLGFELDMSDTTSTYSVSFFVRVDSPEHKFRKTTEFPLKVDWVSPGRKMYSETVYLPPDSFEGADSFVHDLCTDYRTDLVPYEHGLWNLYVTPPAVDGLRGIGVILKKNMEWEKTN